LKKPRKLHKKSIHNDFNFCYSLTSTNARQETMKKERYTLIIAALMVLGVIALEVRRSTRETPVTDSEAVVENGYRGISSQQLMERMREGDGFILVDLRTPDEFKEGHIKGAVNIPISMIERGLEGLDKEKEIILYCKSGPWSRQAYKMLKAKGFSDIKVLANGIVGWKWEVNGEVVASTD
jgi:rhodanese-related sulfurtransferase